MRNKLVELLAPARDLATGRVAIDAGADAVYIGGPGFGARRAAGNSLDDVAKLIGYARPFGVRVYATLNTLLTEDELEEARTVALGLTEAGVDALIVQDMAFMRMAATTNSDSIREFSGIEFHASTQTSNIVPEEVAFLGRAGFRRVILERALSLDEIRAVRAACPEETEIEVFVHGAICVGYSGRCFFSIAKDGTRSGNRGDCSQPCRLAYDLVDVEGRVLLKGRHLLSVRDLDLGARLGELLDAGVSSFKIEGRLKDAGYVRNVVSHYRRLLDEALAVRPGLRRASVGTSVPDFTPDPAKSFTRGGTDYFLDGARAGVASFNTPKAMGERLGTVAKTGCERTGNRFFTMDGHGGDRGRGELCAGDGLCFFAGGELRGTNVNRIEGGRVYPNNCEGIAPGTEIFRNHDRAFVRALESSRMKRRIGASACVETAASRVAVTFTDETGLSSTVSREGEFDAARDPLEMVATVREELSKSGDTIFEVRHVEIAETRVSTFVPVSLLARLRREGLERLFELRDTLPPRRDPAVEDTAARAPRTLLTSVDNVTNTLAERFWRDHGVTEIAPALELRDAAPGDVVMRTRYCIRREIGECLRGRFEFSALGLSASESVLFSPGSLAAGTPAPSSPCEKIPRSEQEIPSVEKFKRPLKEGTKLRSDLFLERGRERWRLAFDCNACEMTIEKI